MNYIDFSHFVRRSGRRSKPSVRTTAFVVVTAILACQSNIFAERSGADANTNGQAQRYFPEIFATELQEYGLTFSPDGSAAYFTRGNGIFWTYRTADGWVEAQEAAFSRGHWLSSRVPANSEIILFNWDPVISPDGSRMFIMSHGLREGKIVEGENGDIDLWMLRRTGAGYHDTDWSDPVNLGPNVNTEAYSEGAAGISADNTLYFFSTGRPDSRGRADIYVSQYEGGEYLRAKSIGEPINTEFWDGHIYVDPQRRFVLYIIVGDPNGYGSCDLYVSRREENSWTTPRNLGPSVNTEQCELTPSLSPDGTELYFGRSIGSAGNAADRDIFAIPLSDTDF